jgi:hypothetical protein
MIRHSEATVAVGSRLASAALGFRVLYQENAANPARATTMTTIRTMALLLSTGDLSGCG